MTAEQQIRSGQHRAGPGHDGTSRSGTHATPETVTELVDHAGVLLAAYDFAGAYQLLIEVRSRIDHGVEVDHTDAVDAIRMLAETMLALGRVDDAAELIADLAAWAGLGPYQAAMLAVTRARLLTAQHRLTEAADCYRDILRHHPPPQDPTLWPALLAAAGAASVTAANGRPGTAEPALTAAYTRLVDEYGTDHVDVIRIGVELAQLRVQVGGYDAARRLAAQLMPAAVAGLGERHPLITRLADLVDRLNAEHRDGVPAATGRRDAATSAAPTIRPTRRRWPATGRWAAPYWAPLTVVVCLGVASATAVTVAAIATLVPARVPAASRSPAAGVAPARAPWTAVHPPAGDVRIVQDTGTTIDVTWTDPTGGTRPTILFIAKDGAPATVAATVQAATTNFRLTGLDPRARRYCIGVAVAYGPATLARAPDMCTSRPASSPTPRRSSAPSLPRSVARRRSRPVLRRAAGSAASATVHPSSISPVVFGR